jgi:plasmid stabilization system protein ParE
MARVVVTENAKRDVRAIISDLHRIAGHTVASRYAADFKTVYKDLAQFPDSGAPRAALGRFARIKLVYPYVVIYDSDAGSVAILRVLDGRRDITVDLIGRR